MSDQSDIEKVTAVVGDLVGAISKESPEMGAILNDESLTQEQRLTRVMELIQTDPHLEEKINRATQKILDSQKALILAPEQKAEVLAPVIMESPHEGLPRLNPLYEAALIERSQYDGDMPELRTGPLPEDAMPAVPVLTDARSSVAIGEMLRIASVDMKEDLQEHRKQMVKAIADGKLDTLGLVAKHGEILAQQDVDRSLTFTGSAETDLATYRRGELPKPVAVATPTGSSLATMTQEEQRTHAWKFLSSTQGRRTATIVIQNLIREKMESAGVPVTSREFDSKAINPVVVTKKWTVNLGGAGSTQPAFSFIDVASKILVKSLLEGVTDDTVPLILEVISIDQLDTRTVGWAARLVRG